MNTSPMSSGTPNHVVIVGAGIVGAAAAFFLSRLGIEATIIEGETPSAGATGSADGAVSVGTKRPGPLMHVAKSARGLYEVLLKEGVFSGLYHPRSTFLIARGDAEMALVVRHAEDMAAAGEPTSILDDKQLAAIMPGLGSSVTGGAEVPRDGHAIGYEITDRLLTLSRAKVLRNAPVIGIDRRGGRVTGVRTQSDFIAAERVVVAAGLGCRQLLDLGSVIVPRKGQMIITDRLRPSGPALAGHIISAQYLAAKRSVQPDGQPVSLVIDPLVTGQLLIGGSRETGVEGRRTDVETIAAILREAIDLYPAVADTRVIRTFAGVRTATVDGLPIVGQVPGCEGLFVATGFEGDGICLGPLMAKITVDLALGRPAELNLSAFTPERLSVGGVAA